VICSFAPPVVLLPIEVGAISGPSLHESVINVEILRELPTSPDILLWLLRDVKIWTQSDMSNPFQSHTSPDGQLIP
jgi:hypothetical protein